jgi:hypothetical protein
MSDLSRLYDYTQSLQAAQSNIEEFKTICLIVQAMNRNSVPLLSEKREINGLSWMVIQGRVLVSLKPGEQYTEYQRQENSFKKQDESDRVFPLETVEIQHFRTDHDTDIEEAIIHTGPYANEYARSLNALAVTMGVDIFFRNNAFSTSTEEGRKTLVHELTHVAQYKEGKFDGKTSVGELEIEATASEGTEEYDDDPYCILRLGKNRCRIRKSEIDLFATRIADALESRIEEQKYVLNEEDYLKFLTGYMAWLKEGAGSGLFGA